MTEMNDAKAEETSKKFTKLLFILVAVGAGLFCASVIIFIL
jgi:hypothetical protein